MVLAAAGGKKDISVTGMAGYGWALTTLKLLLDVFYV